MKRSFTQTKLQIEVSQQPSELNDYMRSDIPEKEKQTSTSTVHSYPSTFPHELPNFSKKAKSFSSFWNEVCSDTFEEVHKMEYGICIHCNQKIHHHRHLDRIHAHLKKCTAFQNKNQNIRFAKELVDTLREKLSISFPYC